MKLKNILLLTVLLGISWLQLIAQNQPPQVTNILFSQRTDGSFIVDIDYDVNDPEGNSMTVTIQVSSDNGATWDFSCNNILGDVGAGITSGTLKHIEWDFGAEHSQTFGDQFRIKIIADDGGTTTGVPCPGIATITYEGKVYNTVQIGDQCWLKENLDVGTRVNLSQGQSNNSIKEKYCYNNLESNCNIYGGLYQWSEAMQYVTTPGTRGICPTGWHIPTQAQFQTLSNFVGGNGNALKEIGQGTGTNTSGFSAMLGGFGSSDGNFYFLSFTAYFFSSNEYNDGNANGMILFYNDANIYLNASSKSSGYSIRCLKN